VQHRTWNLAALFRLPTHRGPVWLKAIPPFAAAEPVALAAYRHADPALVPEVIAAGPGRLLLADVPGAEGGSATEADVAAVVARLVGAQARLEVPAAAIPDRRPEVQQTAVDRLLDGPLRDELTPAEHAAVHRIQAGWARLAASGLPDTLVHGDFHPGNWRLTAAGPVVLDFADAHLGHPALDACRAIDYLPPHHRAAAARAWIAAWSRAAPRSRPADALRIAHLAYAVRYQEFLDNIEPTERLYHLGDPATVTRHAIAAASQPPPIRLP
jgi:Ser/Thr protein kinase RdoA (MazF antagonist)